MEDIPLETKPMYSGIVAEAKTTVYADAMSEDAERHKENWSKVTEQFRNNGKAAEIITRASESVKDSYTVNSADTKEETKDTSSSFITQNLEETFGVANNVTEKMASNMYAETYSAQSAVQDVLTSSIVSQNTDALNKLSEHSNYARDSLLKDSFISSATSTEQTTGYEAQEVKETLNFNENRVTSSFGTENVQESQKSIEELARITQSLITQTNEVKEDPLQKIRSVPFNPEELKQEKEKVSMSAEEAVSGFRSVKLDVASNNQVSDHFFSKT